MTSLGDHGLPSPITSALSPTPSQTSSSDHNSGLPTQRNHQLIPGSPKEIALITYVDSKVLDITRRYATKFTNIKTKAKELPGYTTLEQFIRDINPLIDLVWTSGTPNLQIPYILTFAGMLASYIPAFPFTKSMFQLLRRLDMAFSSLLRSQESRASLRPIVSTTEKVRIKSLADETRMVAMRHGSSAGHAVDVVDVSEEEEEDDDDDDDDDNDDNITVVESLASHENIDEIPANSRRIAIALSKIYESTVEILGDSLKTPDFPVQTDDSMDTS